MRTDTTVTVLGGDLRQISVAEVLLSFGMQVYIWGLPREKCPEKAVWQEDWKTAVSNADVVVLPLPSAHDGKRVATPLMPETAPIYLEELFETLRVECFLAVGKMEAEAVAAAQQHGILVYDYFKSEALQQKNALPTAEGAVMIAMRETSCTVAGHAVAVTGFGRIARALAALLAAMGARVTVAARSPKALREARALGYGTVSLAERGGIKRLGSGYRVVYNTVPSCLFTEAVLKSFDKNTLLIDLASSPGGVDAEAAGRLGVRVIWALSLPGKYAPETAGRIIAETVMEALRGEGRI